MYMYKITFFKSRLGVRTYSDIPPYIQCMFVYVGLYIFVYVHQKNASLEVLDLSWNGLQNSGGIAIGQALKVNKSLRVLDLR